jgi:hypothetical protein
MQLTRSFPRTGGTSVKRSYGCAECGLWTAGSSEAPDEAANKRSK